MNAVGTFKDEKTVPLGARCVPAEEGVMHRSLSTRANRGRYASWRAGEPLPVAVNEPPMYSSACGSVPTTVMVWTEPPRTPTELGEHAETVFHDPPEFRSSVHLQGGRKGCEARAARRQQIATHETSAPAKPLCAPCDVVKSARACVSER